MPQIPLPMIAKYTCLPALLINWIIPQSFTYAYKHKVHVWQTNKQPISGGNDTADIVIARCALSHCARFKCHCANLQTCIHIYKLSAHTCR